MRGYEEPGCFERSQLASRGSTLSRTASVGRRYIMARAGHRYLHLQRPILPPHNRPGDWSAGPAGRAAAQITLICTVAGLPEPDPATAPNESSLCQEVAGGLPGVVWDGLRGRDASRPECRQVVWHTGRRRKRPQPGPDQVITLSGLARGQEVGVMMPEWEQTFMCGC